MLPGFKPSYNIVPSENQWTILLDDTGKPAARQLRWGLVPSWSADPSVGARLINARSDAVAIKPSFEASFKNRRCVILADGFYEWSGVGKTRAPYFFHLDGHRDFALAGLWDRWQRGGEVLETCTIITTDSSEFAARVHHRMPVVLTPDRALEWVAATTPEPRLLELLGPYDAPDLECHEVSRLVNSPANNSAECIEPFERQPKPKELTLWDI